MAWPFNFYIELTTEIQGCIFVSQWHPALYDVAFTDETGLVQQTHLNLNIKLWTITKSLDSKLGYGT